LLADLNLLVGFEEIDDAVDGFVGVNGMQRREYEVAGFDGGHSRSDGLGVAHLADKNDVGVLAQRAAKGVRER
jgi:hypothetical protein